MTDDDKKTRIAKPTPSVEDKPEGKPDVVFTHSEYMRMIEAQGMADKERSKAVNENFQLKDQLRTETNKHTTYVTRTDNEIKNLKRQRTYTGLISAIGGAALAAAVLGSTDCSCSGDVGPVKMDYSTMPEPQRRDKDIVSDAGADADISECKDIRGCYDQKHVDDLNTNWRNCEEDLSTCHGDLEACLKENGELKDKLSKKQKCEPTYIPGKCAPVQECPAPPLMRTDDYKDTIMR